MPPAGAAPKAAVPVLVIDGRGLLLIGPVGVGKTHLAVAILRELRTQFMQMVRPVFAAEALDWERLG